ncbi:MAG: VCBS repeat-containing protein [Bacteroidia bacterium]
MNNDGYLDMIFSTLSGTSPILRVFLNNRNNTFTQLNTMNGVGYETGYLTAADFNADGYMDYMISGDNGSGRYFELMRGTSQQSFNSAASLTGLDNSWMAWGDYDVDGQMDGAYVGNTSTDEVFALGIQADKWSGQLGTSESQPTEGAGEREPSDALMDRLRAIGSGDWQCRPDLQPVGEKCGQWQLGAHAIGGCGHGTAMGRRPGQCWQLPPA